MTQPRINTTPITPKCQGNTLIYNDCQIRIVRICRLTLSAVIQAIHRGEYMYVIQKM